MTRKNPVIAYLSRLDERRNYQRIRKRFGSNSVGLPLDYKGDTVLEQSHL